MSNRFYRLNIGLIILLSLYTDLPIILFTLIAVVLVEGLTNFRIPQIISKLRFGHEGDPNEGTLAIAFQKRFNFEAERAWRLMVGIVLLATHLVSFHEIIWFVPWFMGFAIIGAGASGVCPMFLSLKWFGFK